MKLFRLIPVLLIPFIFTGYFSPRTQSNNIASSDVLAGSSDTNYVGVASNYWRENYVAYQRFSLHMVPPVAVTSFGVLYVSTDSSLRFRKPSGAETVLVA